MARDGRKKARKARLLGEAEEESVLVPAVDGQDGDDDNTEDFPEKERKARELIKAGMGKISRNKDKESSKFAVVSAEETARFIVGHERRPLPAVDEGQYNSDNEDYVSNDYAQTLTLGTMILYRGKEKALVDASYNRFTCNGPTILPDWFVDDEQKNYRPQLPIPPAIMAKMKERMMTLAARLNRLQITPRHEPARVGVSQGDRW